MPSKLVAIEYVFPERKISNHDLSKEFPDYDFSNFEKKVGIKNRYIVTERESAIDLAIMACEKLFTRFLRSDIDIVIYCTQSPEYFLPTTACILQDRLNLRKDIAAFDYNLGCSGYPYGLAIAKGFLETGLAKNVLLITSETYSKYIHPQDRSNRAIFGDAASASIISYNEVEKIFMFKFGTDGSGYDKLIVKNGAGRCPLVNLPELKEYGSANFYTDNHLYMDGPEIMNFTTTLIPQFIEQILELNNLSKENVEQFILHQANSFMLNIMRKKLKIDSQNFYNNMEDGGNTVSSTLPIALKRYSQQTNKGDTAKILLCGFGVGLSWSGGVIDIDNKL